MSYAEDLSSAWTAEGPAGALALLRAIFQDPANQAAPGKPSDYLDDDDDGDGDDDDDGDGDNGDEEGEDSDTSRPSTEVLDPRKRTAAQGFEQLMRLFVPKESAAERAAFVARCLVESRDPEADQRHRAQPFNGLLLTINTYDHGDAVLDSVHYDPREGVVRRAFGLNHEVVHAGDNYDEETDDDEHSYAFIGALKRRKLRYRDEEVPGERLFLHVRMAQYALFLRDVLEALLADEAFADFPKQLPLHFLVRPEPRGQPERVAEALELRALLTAEVAATLPLGPRHLASARPLPPLTPREQWQHLLRFMTREKAPERKKLVALLKKDDARFADTQLALQRSLAHAALSRGSIDEEAAVLPPPPPELVGLRSLPPPTDFVRLYFDLGPSRLAEARAAATQVLALPPPALPRGDLEATLPRAEAAIAAVYETFALVPEGERAALQPAFEAACARLAAVDHPVLRVLALEAELRREHGDDCIEGANEDEVSYTLEALPPAYLAAVIAALDEMPQAFAWYGPQFSFALGRLQGMGTQAREAAPRVVALMERYCTDLHDGGQALERFAQILHALGLEEPPQLIRDYVEHKQYHGLDFYEGWAKGVVERRVAELWSALAAAPASFDTPERWEEALYDSDLARKLVVKGLAARPDATEVRACLARALRRGPGPRLGRLVTALVGDEIADEPADIERQLQLLEALPERDREQQEILEQCQVYLLKTALDAGDPAVDARLVALLAARPAAPMVRYCQVERLEQTQGGTRAAEAALSTIRALTADDRVYAKAYFQLTGNDAESWEAARAEDAYALFRWAQELYSDSHYREGVLRATPGALAQDPLYAALEQAYAGTAEAAAAKLAEVRAELAIAARLQAAPLEALRAEIDPTRMGVCRLIARRWLTDHARWAPELLALYDRLRKDEDRRLALLKLLWPVEAFRPALLAHPPFQKDLKWFLDRYPVSTVVLARLCFQGLAALQQHGVVLELAKKLDAELVMATFLSIEPSLRAADPAAGVVVLERVAKKLNKKKPEQVLVQSNLAVMHIRAGDLGAAEGVFDKLFAADYSRFEHTPDEDDEALASILGGDLDAQIAAVFRQYWASAKYNVACLYALTARPEQAVEALREARAKHPAPYDAAKLRGERDFDPIRAHAAFAALLSELEGANR